MRNKHIQLQIAGIQYHHLSSDASPPDDYFKQTDEGRESYQELGYQDKLLSKYDRVKSVDGASRRSVAREETGDEDAGRSGRESILPYNIREEEGKVIRDVLEERNYERPESVNFASRSASSRLAASPGASISASAYSSEKYTMDKKFVCHSFLLYSKVSYPQSGKSKILFVGLPRIIIR